MQNILQIIQIVLSLMLVLVVLLQQRGTGLGGAFGGQSNVYRSKRGIEKFLYWGTIVVAILFVASSIFNLVYLS